MTAVAPSPELERLAPAFQFRERHSTTVRATPERINRAIYDVTGDEIFLFRALERILGRGRPRPGSFLSDPERRGVLERATRSHFAWLAQQDREVVVGTVVGRPAGTARPTSAEDILAARSQPGYAIATMNFAIAPRGDGSCLVSTETRVFATDAASRRRFTAYWLLIRGGSGFLRRMWLRAIRRRAEAA